MLDTPFTKKQLKFCGFWAWLFWLFVHVYFLIGFRNRMVVMMDWAWAYFTSQRPGLPGPSRAGAHRDARQGVANGSGSTIGGHRQRCALAVSSQQRLASDRTASLQPRAPLRVRGRVPTSTLPQAPEHHGRRHQRLRGHGLGTSGHLELRRGQPVGHAASVAGGHQHHPKGSQHSCCRVCWERKPCPAWASMCSMTAVARP
jgi:hypothetical protein